MENEHREVLRKVLVYFMAELDNLAEVIHSLQLDGVLNDKQRDRILQSSGMRDEKIREQYLIETLSRCGPRAFGSFIKALNLHQDWLATRLQTELVLSNGRVKEIFLANSNDVGGIVDTLYSRDVLSVENKKHILEPEYTTKEKQVQQLLRILPSTGPDALDIFTDVLLDRSREETSCAVLASVLQDIKSEYKNKQN